MYSLNLQLPEWYVRRNEIKYYDDTTGNDCLLIHQPEVYTFADYLLRHDHKSILIDLGCGSGRKIKPKTQYQLIGVDQGINLASFKRRHPGSIIVEHDFEAGQIAWPADIDWHKSVVVCADVIEHLINPIFLLNDLLALANRGAVILLSTPDRERVYNGEHYCPPANPSHAQEWSLLELYKLLETHGLPVAFIGHTISDNFLRLKNTSLIVCDRRASFSAKEEPEGADIRPLAIIAAYNDEDIIDAVGSHYLQNGLDLHLIDNWSDDKTYLQMVEMKRRYPDRVSIEQFPTNGPQHEYKWAEILIRKAEIAAEHKHRWVLHVDSDEIRLSPWRNCSLAEALRRVSQHGYNVVDHCVINFIPTRDKFDNSDDINLTFNRFQFGRHPAHFIQKRTWVQPENMIDLSSSGGHTADFEGATVYPYRFPLLHFPIRSQEHGSRKIYKERLGRYSRAERAERGWHNHYDSIPADQKFISLPELGLVYRPEQFLSEYIVEILTDIVHERSKGSLLFE